MYNKLFGRTKTFEVNAPEVTYKVHYLGNVMTSLIKGTFNHGAAHTYRKINNTNENDQAENTATLTRHHEDEERRCNGDAADDDQLINDMMTSATDRGKLNMTFIDKSVKILWDNHVKHQGHAGIKMKLTLTQGGLRVTTKDHGLTEYYGHRIHLVKLHKLNGKLIVWVYQHVGKNLKSEIRCHAALCEKVKHAKNIEASLNDKLQQTFLEYKREKKRMQNSRLCNTKNHGLLVNQVDSKKRVFRSVTHNYKPPVQHGMCSAPKLDDVIEEDEDDLLGFNEVCVDDCYDARRGCGNSSTDHAEDDDEDEEETATTATFNHIELDDDENDELDTDLEDGEEAQRVEDDDFFDESSEFNYYNQMNGNEPATAIIPTHHHRHNNHFAAEQHLVLSSSSSASSTTSSSASSAAACNNSNSHTVAGLVVPSVSIVAKYMHEGMTKNIPSVDGKQFVEVSYDFLGDLSKAREPAQPTCESQFRKNMNLSKSFISRNIRPPVLHASSLIDPFRRTSISKSFTSFTSRFKQHQNEKSGDQDLKTDDQAAGVTGAAAQSKTAVTVAASGINNKIVKVNNGSALKASEMSKFKNLNLNSASTTTNSSLSSPTLSTSSYLSNGSVNNREEDEDSNELQLVISL